MTNIEPIVFPLVGTATKLSVLVLAFPTDATIATTYYEVQTEEGKVCVSGNYTLTEEQYTAWGQDNSVVDGYVANYVGVVIV